MSRPRGADNLRPVWIVFLTIAQPEDNVTQMLIASETEPRVRSEGRVEAGSRAEAGKMHNRPGS